MELPPRARRIHTLHYTRFAPLGTTSACAENTPLEGAPYVWGGNYLRVRGEYTVGTSQSSPMVELPPRARRIQRSMMSARYSMGTTSACAENTVGGGLTQIIRGNYLRVRGEYVGPGMFREAKVELPPRARRILSMMRPIT